MHYFSTQDAIRFGTTLGDEFAAAASPELIQYLKEHTPLPQNSAIQSLLKKAFQQSPSLHLNIFKRLIVFGAFKNSLLKHNFSQRTIEDLVGLLTPCLFARRVSPQEVPAVKPESTQTRQSLPRLFSEAQHCIAHKQFDKALLLLDEYTKSAPQDAIAATNFGVLLLQQGNAHRGEQELRRAIALAPRLASPYLNLGSLLLWQGDLLSAESLLYRAVKLDPTNTKTLNTLAAALGHINKLQQAELTYKKALELEPNDAIALSGLGALHSLLGHKTQCIEYFEKALRADPQCAEALVGLSHLRLTPERTRELTASIRKILESGCSATQEISLRFSLGALLDKANDFKGAFQQYAHANELRKQSARPYDPVRHSQMVNNILRTYTQECLSVRSNKASLSKRPVFVIGMMRSGTSLVEQIIASHPAVHGAGELEYWHQVVQKQPKLNEHNPPDDRTIKKLAEGYLKLLDKCSRSAARIIDKATFNLNYLGLIYKVFPETRIIWVRRDPVDTCLSCYFNNFVNGAAFTMDLESLAYYYREQHKLALHWQRVLPASAFLEVRYEDLVAEQEKWSRKMLEFIGLDWDPTALEFHKTNRPVLTASAWQVRERMYSNSIGRWKAYRKYIKPLLKLHEISEVLPL